MSRLAVSSCDNNVFYIVTPPSPTRMTMHHTTLLPRHPLADAPITNVEYSPGMLPYGIPPLLMKHALIQAAREQARDRSRRQPSLEFGTMSLNHDGYSLFPMLPMVRINVITSSTSALLMYSYLSLIEALLGSDRSPIM